MTPFKNVFTTHAATSMARQIALSDLIGERSWGIDIGAGTITFDDDLRFPIQILGTHSEANNTWLWAWGNQQSDLPEALTEASLAVKAYGESHAVEELTERMFTLDDGLTDHMLAMACRGLVDAACYYRAPYQGGAALVLLGGLPAEVTAPVAQERAAMVLMQTISNFTVDHRPMAESFLRQQGFQVTNDGARMQAARPSGAQLHIEFDELGRMANMEAKFVPLQ